MHCSRPMAHSQVPPSFEAEPGNEAKKNGKVKIFREGRSMPTSNIRSTVIPQS